MIISMNLQIRLVVFSMLAGMLTGVLFDIYRVIRGINNKNGFINAISDILFWFFCSIVIFIFLLKTQYGFIGVYPVLCIVLGTYLYHIFFSKKFLKIFYRGTLSFSKTLRILFNFIFYPFQLIFHGLYKNKKK